MWGTVLFTETRRRGGRRPWKGFSGLGSMWLYPVEMELWRLRMEFWGDFCLGGHQSMDGFKATSLGEMTKGGGERRVPRVGPWAPTIHREKSSPARRLRSSGQREETWEGVPRPPGRTVSPAQCCSELSEDTNGEMTVALATWCPLETWTRVASLELGRTEARVN